jgi:hypothetical protein
VRRRQLVELEDLAWCPRVVRDGGTDWLAFMANTTRVFSAVVPKIRCAMAAVGTNQVVDLCSGGGGPWLTLVDELARSGPIEVQLSDRFPNVAAFQELHVMSQGRLGFREEPIDASDVPGELRGVRTLFNCFHHFPPDIAAAILHDAVRKRRPIAIFEGISHRAIGLVAIPLQVPALLLLTPFVRPFRWSRILLTYILPMIPFLVAFDGTVSLLRVYLPHELRALVASVPNAASFEWDIGTTSVARLGIGLTHLIGVPKPDTW